jgi:hypothetical protein
VITESKSSPEVAPIPAGDIKEIETKEAVPANGQDALSTAASNADQMVISPKFL